MMTIDHAIEIVKNRYGILTSYLDARTGKMMTVVRAERQLRAIRQVPLPDTGIALMHSDLIELAEGRVTVKGLVRRKNPEIFAAELGARGGKVIAKRGPDYFRQLQAKRKTHAGGRPPKRAC
jgi:hypothetical protein